MLQTGVNSEFYQTMDLFNEIDDLNDFFFLEKSSKLDSASEEDIDLQSKYSSLHENYAKEVKNSKKVEKYLVKCLKFYSKLCKKYEVQQKVISNLEETLKEKIISLEEAQKNEERMKGLIQVYRTERALYSGQTNSQLRKDKQLLLEICCKLISDSIKTNTLKNMTNLILRKFKDDLDDEKINVLKGKCSKVKDELDFSGFEILKPYLTDFKKEVEFKSKDKVVKELTKVEVKELEKNTKIDPLDLSLCKTMSEENDFPQSQHLNDISDIEHFITFKENASNVGSSLPSLEELPITIQLSKNQCENGVSVDKSREECDLSQSKSIKETQKSDAVVKHLEKIRESAPSAICATETEKEPLALMVQETLESATNSIGKLDSIFDVSDSCLIFNNCREEMKQQNSVAVEFEDFSGIIFESSDKSEDSKTEKTNLDFIDSDESVFPYEKELSRIFREMSSIRLLSPIRECSDSVITNETSAVNLKGDKNSESEKPKSRVKRNLNADGNSKRNKKFKAEKERTNCNLLDSIMFAMSVQNEEFKTKAVTTKETEPNLETPEDVSSELSSPSAAYTSGSSKENSIVPEISRRREANHRVIEKLVMEEIRNFVSSPISSKEEADKATRRCLSVLSNKSEDVIAKCIVTIVLESVDEAVEIFERPSPPLTKTQHRLIVLLSVFRTLESNSQNISNKILSIISEKLLPDNFFWPDDCVEAAVRFYAALCRSRNDAKTLWKFCLQGMTEMRQRCPLLMLTALKTWPDVLHDASTLNNNILAVTIVNIFLHMPKKEGLRNFNQKRKLVALKHLLLNFYQFKVDDTIESYAKKIVNSMCGKEPGSEKSILLLSKCRDQSWTVKNILPILKSKLIDWSEGRIEDSVASRILSVIKQICPILQEDSAKEKVRDIGFCISKILTSTKKSHDLEVRIIEVLLKLKQYPEVRRVIREWIPKNPIDCNLRNEIINASAENILRELKLNRRKEPKNLNLKKKLKKQSKKLKKKKFRGKGVKKNEQMSKAASACVSS